MNNVRYSIAWAFLRFLLSSLAFRPMGLIERAMGVIKDAYRVRESPAVSYDSDYRESQEAEMTD